MQGRTIIAGAIVVGVLLLAGIAVVVAPDLTEIDAPTTTEATLATAGQPDCLTDDAGACLRLPTVTGVDLDNDPVSLPSAFTTEYVLVIMPFDRDQQVLAADWLPTFQDLAATFDNLSYASIAALPDLNAFGRTGVIVGMSAGVRDQTVRDATAILFLDDQQAFLDALAVDNNGQMQAFIMGQDGTLYWRATGTYTPDQGDDLRDAWAFFVTP
jgi:hypothetical protein